MADLGHICDGSAVGARIDAAAVPLSAAAGNVLAADPGALARVLSGGDDYELLFTAPADRSEAVARLASQCGLHVTAIGAITAQRGVDLQGADGLAIDPTTAGYKHFQ